MRRECDSRLYCRKIALLAVTVATMRYGSEGWFGALQELFCGPRFLTLVGILSAVANPKRAFTSERTFLRSRSLVGAYLLPFVVISSAAADPKRAFIGERAPLQYRSLAELYGPSGWSRSVCLSFVDPSADLSAMETTTPKDVNTTIFLLLNTLIFATAREPSTRRTTIGAARSCYSVRLLGLIDFAS